MIDYAIGEFGRPLRAALSSMSSDLASLRLRKDQLEGKIGRFAEAIAHGGPLDTLVQQIATREKELKAITNRLLTASASSIEGQLREIRQFVEKGFSDLRELLNRDTAIAKTEL